MILTLAGGVGAARMLRGLLAAFPDEQHVAVVNTADDEVLHGLAISPDLDTVLYTLAGANDDVRGWGLQGETWQAMESLRRYSTAAGRPDIGWFNLGDRDLGTHLYRTTRLHEGATLTEVTAELVAGWELPVTLLPVTDDPLATHLTTVDGELTFQEYFVRHQHGVAVTGVRFAGAEAARPGPEVPASIAAAETIVLAPSNPIVSIGPLLAVPGVRDAVAARRDHVVAVSPIIGGKALKGPADRLLAELGHESSALGVARIYRELAGAMVIDEEDAALAPEIEALGMRCVVAPTIMRDADTSAALARMALAAVA
ncbi:MAG: 2-phospho-L-lactate transferase [Acidimicrobiales bacterium]